MPQVVNWQVQKELQFQGARTSAQSGLEDASNQYRRQAVLKNFGESRRHDGYIKYLRRNQAIQDAARERIMTQIKDNIQHIEGYKRAVRKYRYDRLVCLNDPEDMELAEFEKRPTNDRARQSMESKLINGGWNPTRLRDEVKLGMKGDEKILRKEKFMRKLKGHVARTFNETDTLHKQNLPLKVFYSKRKERSVGQAQQRIGSPTTKSMKLYASSADTFISKKTIVDKSFLDVLHIPFTHFKKLRLQRQPTAQQEEEESEESDDESVDESRESTAKGPARGEQKQPADLLKQPSEDDKSSKQQQKPQPPSDDVRAEYLGSKADSVTEKKPPLVRRESTVIKAKPAVVDMEMIKSRQNTTVKKSSLGK